MDLYQALKDNYMKEVQIIDYFDDDLLDFNATTLNLVGANIQKMQD
jgi:hypothetical protein